VGETDGDGSGAVVLDALTVDALMGDACCPAAPDVVAQAVSSPPAMATAQKPLAIGRARRAAACGRPAVPVNCRILIGRHRIRENAGAG
jgi:hypothetical protein